jgi:hypothetical protein
MHTMTRCVIALILALAALGTVNGQTVQRSFAATALRGEIAFGQPPEIRLNGQDARLSPGARIRGQNNLLQMSGSLRGQSLVVNYALDSTGQVQDVWILNDDERARLPWPKTVQEAKTWAFDPVAQAWTPR